MVKPNENTLFPIYQSLAHAGPFTCTESARGEETLLTKGTGPREEANRVEPSPFTEKPSLPPALPVQEEPDASTCVVPVAPREGCPRHAQGQMAIADRPGGCPTAYAFAVLRHLRVNGPASDGAAASDMGISYGDAWRAQDQLWRIGAIEFDRIGQMVRDGWRVAAERAGLPITVGGLVPMSSFAIQHPDARRGQPLREEVDDDVGALQLAPRHAQ